MNLRENKVNTNLKHIFHGLFVAAIVASDVMAANAPAPRSAVNAEHIRATGTTPRTRQSTNTAPRTTTSRAAKNVVSRSATATTERPRVTNRSAQTTLTRARNIISNAGEEVIRRAFGLDNSVARSAGVARSAKPSSTTRAGAVPATAVRARATAVFSDISKLGEGYNKCRDTYNTCMDQFCAGANETYRRCFCSDNFRMLRDKEEALDAATTMLAQFESNNLEAVTKTAAEVNAMYTATAGEQAIKNDTSAAAAMLNSIGDLLSGKKKASEVEQPKKNSMDALSGATLDFSSDLGDIWGNSSDSLFKSEDEGVDLATLEGTELYKNSHAQCMDLIGASCDNSAVKNMTKSAYSILITQDCNAYQKKLDQKTEQVKSTVRTAEKYLREARLEEYRAHNSSDVNDCLDKVEKAMLNPMACGASYEKCLDYTGAYISMATGEPIYSPRLFKLNEIIVLDGQSADVLTQNSEMNKFLDDKRRHAQSALDTCRDYADEVWTEFKRTALIKIAQAQDEKIEEVKMSCVTTMKECYDSIGGQLKDFDDTTAQASGALAARASSEMCKDKVLACATLYASSDENAGCTIDTKTNKVVPQQGKSCGIQALLNFVGAVDDTRVAEGCGNGVKKFLEDLCTPSEEGEVYPWKCRLRNFGTINALQTTADQEETKNSDGTYTVTGGNWVYKKGDNSSLFQMVVNHAYENCGAKRADGTYEPLETKMTNEIAKELERIQLELESNLRDKCIAMDGVWYTKSVLDTLNTNMPSLRVFYQKYFGGNDNDATKSLGQCCENTVKSQCLSYNSGDSKEEQLATYNPDRDECEFKEAWYQRQCQLLGDSYYTNGVCYVKPNK